MDEINIEELTPNINIDTATRNYHLPIASATVLGGIKVGSNLTIEEDGKLNAEATEYNLPTATASTLGGIKVGTTLNIADQVLNANVDQALDNSSTNPVRNSVITTAIGELTNDLSTVSGNLTTLSNNFDTLSGTVASHTSTLSTLGDTVTALDGAVTQNTDDIAGNTSSIGDLSDSVTSLESTVTTMGDTVDSLTTDVDGLTVSTLDEVTYSYLLPVSTWTAGSIIVVRRGKVGFIYFDLEGSLTLASDASAVIYTFSELLPAVKATNTLLTDHGTILGTLDDYSMELSLTNMGSNSITITKVKGSIPLVFE